jgi:hypothetical protein
MLVTEDSNKSQKPGKLPGTRDVGQRNKEIFFPDAGWKKRLGKKKKRGTKHIIKTII